MVAAGWISRKKCGGEFVQCAIKMKIIALFVDKSAIEWYTQPEKCESYV